MPKKKKPERAVLSRHLPKIRKAHVSKAERNLVYNEAEISETEWLKAAATNPAFDFLSDPEEDIYTLANGKPFLDN